MYNNQVKNKYINQLKSEQNQKVAQSMLNIIGEKIESYYQKDLFELEFADIINRFSAMEILHFRQMRQYLSRIKNYLKWAVAEGYADHLYFPDINVRSLDNTPAIRKYILKDFNELKEIIENVYPKNVWTNGIHSATLLLLLWTGLTSQEITELKTDEVDLIHGKIYKDNKVIIDEIDDDIIHLLTLYKNTIWVERTIGLHGYIEYYSTKLLTSPYFMKKDDTGKTQNIKYKTTYIRDRISLDNTRVQLTCDGVVLSGKLNRLYQMELSGTVINLDLIADMFGYENIQTRSMQSNDMLKLYANYKEVYWK